MQVVLLKQINHIGNTGDIKNVADGYFRNFLLPRGFAKLATPASIKEAQNFKNAAALRIIQSKEEFKKLLEIVQKEEFLITRKANEEGHLFGSVTEKDIKELLQEKGYIIQEGYIKLEAPLKSVGSYPVLLLFDKDLQGFISIKVERSD